MFLFASPSSAYLDRLLIKFTVIDVNTAVAWFQVHDVKGGGLCVWLAPIPRKKTIATETDTEEKHANGARGKPLRKLRK